MKHYCRIHRDETIMKATETVLGPELWTKPATDRLLLMLRVMRRS
jgi:hypothetical protein